MKWRFIHGVLMMSTPSSFFLFVCLFVCLTHLFFSFTCRVIKRDREEAALLICSLTCSLNAGAALKCFSSVSRRRWILWCMAFETAHIVHLLRVNSHPGPRCTNVKTGLDWKETDYWPVQKCLAKLYSFLLSFLSGLIVIQCMRV